MNVIPPPPQAPPQVFVVGNAAVPAGISERNSIRQIVYWIGFRGQLNINAIVDDAFSGFSDIRVLTEKDITSMSSGFASRTQADGRILFGTRRTKLLKALIHWNEDFFRVSQMPSIVGLTEAIFKAQLERALVRSDIRKALQDQTSTAATAANPGPLKSEKEWKQWEEKFTNYAAAHQGVGGVPLSYVIREADLPAPNINYPDFVTMTIACTPLAGEYFQADKLTVFNMIIAFTTGQPSGDWVKATHRYADGRRSMKALRDHFAGEGNATRNISEADRLKESLHYKSKRALAFETFLTQCQKMYHIYEKEGETMPEEAKIRFLFKKVQHTGLKSAVKALKAQMTAGVNVTYTMAANHLSTAVSELPEYVSKNRNVSAVGEDKSEGGSEKPTIYNSDKSIKTGYIQGWHSLSEADQEKVKAKRARKRATRKSGQNSNNNAATSNRMKQLAKQNKKYKRQIKSLKRSTNDDGNNDDSTDDDDEDADAGDQFGGKASKKKRKKVKFSP